ncbi:MAG: hypothetical protein NVSMB19_19970 [Vulcanimicrobiaceae bacterium]
MRSKPAGSPSDERDASFDLQRMKGTLRHLLVATDGSAAGDRAVAFAVAMALRHGSELLLCYVVDRAGAIAQSSLADGSAGMLAPLVQETDDVARSILAAAAQRAAEAGVVVATVVLDGRPAGAIVACATERELDAIVIGTQGKNALERAFLGSSAQGVLRRSEIPTFVVPSGARDADAGFDRILVAVDDSDPSDAAAAFALRIAAADGTTLVFCGVADTRALLEQAATYGYDPMAMRDELHATTSAVLAAQTARAASANVASERVIAEGDPVERILRAAEVHRAGMIVVGTHGRRGLHRWYFGSVAENVVRHSLLPVVVVRATTSRPRS